MAVTLNSIFSNYFTVGDTKRTQINSADNHGTREGEGRWVGLKDGAGEIMNALAVIFFSSYLSEL